MTRDEPPPWSVPVALHEVSESGRQLKLSADETVRERVAKAIGVRSLTRLEASFEVSRRGREGLRVVGEVSATVGQTCVVTLEPIENEISESVELVFAPAPAAAPAVDEAGLAVEGDDGPEPLIGGVVDLGAVATEFLTLGIDPYPRKAGAVFEASQPEDDTAHPFAALAALKDRHGSS
jgi:hypothetical protein